MPRVEPRRPFAGLVVAGRGPHLPRPERLDAPVLTLPGVGPKLAASLGSLGVETVRDLLAYRPRRYEPPAPPRCLADLHPGAGATLEVEILRTGGRPTPRRSLTKVEAPVRD